MARKPQDNPQLDMTPMIDVVFELIIFFVVTLKQEDILSKLTVNKPDANGSPSSSDRDKPCEIEIGKGAHDRGNYWKGVYVLQGQEMSLDQIDDYLKNTVAKNAAKPEEEPVVIKCTGNSPHGALVNLLDRCYKHRLYSISLFSLDN